MQGQGACCNLAGGMRVWRWLYLQHMHTTFREVVVRLCAERYGGGNPRRCCYCRCCLLCSLP
jgi:hypothetical protein